MVTALFTRIEEMQWCNGPEIRNGWFHSHQNLIGLFKCYIWYVSFVLAYFQYIFVIVCYAAVVLIIINRGHISGFQIKYILLYFGL